MLEHALRELVAVEVRKAVSDVFQAYLQQTVARPVISELVTIAQAAALSGHSTSAVRKWLHDGKVRRYGAGKSTRVKPSEVIEFLQRKAQESRTATISDADIDDRAKALLGK